MKTLLKQLNQAFGNRCLLCQVKMDGNSTLCKHCYQSLPFLTSSCPVCAGHSIEAEICGRCLAHAPYYDNSIARFLFTAPVSGFIHQFKYQHQFYLGKWLSEELAQLIKQRNGDRPEVLIPIPAHLKRLRQRGFNQTSLIAGHLSKTLSIPFKNNYLIRTKYDQPQTRLNAKQRVSAVTDAFALKHRMHWQHVALIDDVVSTANTVNQAAKTLKRASVKTVSVWSIARNP